MSSSHVTLAAASDERKARLAKLKNLKRKQPEGEIAPPESDRDSPALPHPPAGEKAEEAADVSRLHLSGRNYDPETRGAKLGFEAPPTLGIEDKTLEVQAAEIEDQIRQKAAEEAAQADKGIDLFKLQPKKPNWDLKRELNKKLEVLNVRTDNAIAKLVRERLAAKKAAAQGAGGAKGVAEDGKTETGMEGAALVEGLRLKEQEEAEEERREREAAEVDVE
ncbi:uncharacterized protein E0L32_006259 [Thyridium curvatum]|uniref:Uncharacterized protein n=1 Tax=Thyridium curvatum TaxID=1093900 RepID=A0A507B2I1_9PEZI|nr:uncharacterized protein E0L32_006259 [Thyridium curvatum]TPX13286.1 hypothetical protein E0L32_006259 [Thyridium curvatum]